MSKTTPVRIRCSSCLDWGIELLHRGGRIQLRSFLRDGGKYICESCRPTAPASE